MEIQQKKPGTTQQAILANSPSVSGFWLLASGFWLLASGFWGAGSKRCGMRVINDLNLS
jgi:hypothetical protein